MFGRTNAHANRPRPLRETAPPPRDTYWSPLRQQTPPPPPPSLPPTLSTAGCSEASADPAQPRRIVRNATVMTLHSDSETDDQPDETQDSDREDEEEEDDDNKDELLRTDQQRAWDLHENDDHFPWHASGRQSGSAATAIEPLLDDSDDPDHHHTQSTTSTTTNTFEEKATGSTPRRSYFTSPFDSWGHSTESTSSDEDEDDNPPARKSDRQRHFPPMAAGTTATEQLDPLNDQPIFGDHLLAPMGFDEEDEFLRNPSVLGASSNSSGTGAAAAQRHPMFAGVNEFDESDQIGLQDSSYHVVAKNRRRDQERILENKRRQGKLLLVSLLDNFCLLYDQSPERNRKLFYVICKTLSNMGIIDEEYLEEMSAVRSSYQRAFRQLVLSALTSIKQEQLILESRRIMAPPSTPTADGHHTTDISRINARLTEPMLTRSSTAPLPPPASLLHTPSIANSLLHEGAFEINDYPSAATAATTTTPLLRTFSFGDMFDNDPTRYKHDFVEIKRLGRGGFASVYKARNKLDGIEYAIKKVRLRGGAKMRYEKIFREIKFLARLDHKNVVRYYSSWLEHADYPISSSSSSGMAQDDGEDEYGDDYDEYEDGTSYLTGDGESSTRQLPIQYQYQQYQQQQPPLARDEKGRRRNGNSRSNALDHTFESSRDDFSMGIVFGIDQSLDFSKDRSIDQDTSFSISFEDDEASRPGIEMAKSASNSTVTGRDIPRLSALSPPVSTSRQRHKSPSVSLEMEGRVPSWNQSDIDNGSEQEEEEEEEVEQDQDKDENQYSGLIEKLATSSRTSSSIEEIQRSLPSSLNDNSSLGSRLGRGHSGQQQQQQQHPMDLDWMDEIDTRAMASYPPRHRPDVHHLQDGVGPVQMNKGFGHGWTPNAVARPGQPLSSSLSSSRHPPQGKPRQPMFTRELTLFIQMQLCQTTLQDYLRYRNDQRGESLRRESMVSSLKAAKATTTATTHHHHHNKHRADRFGVLSALGKSGMDTAAAAAHTQSVPGSPLEGPAPCNNDLVDPAVNQAIFRAIVEGVAYIHEQDMIHRDLKPGNIFLSVPPGMDLEQMLQDSLDNGDRYPAEDERQQQLAMWGESGGASLGNGHRHGQHGFFGGLSSSSLLETLPLEKVQEVLFQRVEQLTPIIGDFGLVTDMDGSLTGANPAQSQVTPATLSSHENSLQQQQQQQDQRNGTPTLSRRSSNMTSASSRARTTAIGTVTYASPEQLARPNMGYDQKADIYSLGIIYFELYYPFSTLMERHAVLRNLRLGELPPEFVSRWPKEAAFVLWLMADDPSLRPSAREILEFDLIRKAPSPLLPKAIEDPLDRAGRAIPPSLSSSSSHQTESAAMATRSADGQSQTGQVCFDKEAEEKGERGGLYLDPSSSSRTMHTSVAVRSPSLRLLTAAEAMQVASSLCQPEAGNLYFSQHPICERCQMQCRCEDGAKQHCGGQGPDVPEKVEKEGERAEKRDQVKQPLVPPVHPMAAAAAAATQKPELKRRSSKRKSHQSKPSQDVSAAAAAASSSLSSTPAGMGGGVSLEAKLKRMEQSLAAMRLENRALLDRIQQLEYEKSL